MSHFLLQHDQAVDYHPRCRLRGNSAMQQEAIFMNIDGQTGNSFLEEDPLSLLVKKENMHETEQKDNLFVPLAKTDDEQTIFNHDNEKTIGDVEERNTESILLTSKCVVCNKIKNNCTCDNVVGKEYDHLNSFAFKEKCLQITNKTDEEMNIITSHHPIHRCTFCQESFTRRSTLESHLSIHVVKKNLTRNFCKKTFYKSSNLKTHLSIHTGEKKFTCNFCKKTFRLKCNLKTHISIHTGEKKFTCNFCKKTFNHSSSLKRHLTIHTGEKKVTCNFCKKTFACLSTLKTHLAIHTGEKKFTCNFCKTRFNQSSNLKKHLAIHTGEKKFTCNFCKKTFNQSSNLKTHLAIHTGEKKFTCNFCKKTFRLKSSLETHLSIHTD
ncbi:uncharacterized protein LOC142332769 [Lycorma delicatula]|uniref:uncharacterized protein LOC142332769 n=1 Tax=Lycorma delicatula TaxID=130591 RepID=UPI003F50F615